MNDCLKPYLYMLAGSIVGVACVYTYLGGFVPAPRFEQQGYYSGLPSYATVRSDGRSVAITGRRLYQPWGNGPWTWGYECRQPDGKEIKMDDVDLLASSIAEDEYDLARGIENRADYQQRIAKRPYGEVSDENGRIVIRNVSVPRRISGLNLIEHRKELPSVYMLGTPLQERWMRYWTDYGTDTVIPFPQAGDRIVWTVDEPYTPPAVLGNAMFRSVEGSPSVTIDGGYFNGSEGDFTFFMSQEITKETP